jgi:acyl carrier protein
MDREKVWAALVEAVREETENPDLVLREAMVANDVPGWDSLAHVRIVMNLEARTGAEIEISDTYKAATLGGLCDIALSALAG